MKNNNNNNNNQQNPTARKDTEFAGSLAPEMDGCECSVKHEVRNAARQLKKDANEKPGSQSLR